MAKAVSFRARARSREFLSGMGLYTFSPAIVEVYGYTGFDFVFIDNEHTPADWQTLEHLVRAAELAGITPIIRVEENSPTPIRKAFEIGAAGVIVPHVNTRDDALRAVSAAKFPPLGRRGIAGLVRSGRYAVSDVARYVEESNERTMVIAMIEEPEALMHLSAIFSVEGLDAVCFGPTDFQVAAGIPGQGSHPRVREALRAVTSEAERRGRAVMMGCWPPTLAKARELIEQGVTMLYYGHDIMNLHQRCLEIRKEIATLAKG